MIKHIFFDLDNTLWDYDKNSILTLKKLFRLMEIEEKFNLDFEKFHENYYERNQELWELYRQDKIKKEDILNRRFKESFEELGVKDQKIADYFKNNYLDKIIHFNYLAENTEESLQYLKDKGYDLHVISNGFINPTQRKVEKTLIGKYISTVTSSEEVQINKPNPKIFEFGLNRANAIAEESAYVGDDWNVDIIGGKNAGLFPVYYDKYDTFSGSSDVPVVKNLIELKEIF